MPVDTGRGGGSTYRIVNEQKERRDIPLEEERKEEVKVPDLPPVIGMDDPRGGSNGSEDR